MINLLFFYFLIPVIISFFFSFKDLDIKYFFSKKTKIINQEINPKEFFREFDLFFFHSNKKIIDKAFLSFSSDRSKNLELLIKNWINFYQQETGNFIAFNSCTLESDLSIIDLKINEKEKINNSILSEFNFFKSIKETIKNAFPEIKKIYFFENEILLDSKNLFFYKEFEILNFENELKDKKSKITFIPLNSSKKLEKITNKILKNYFQEIEIDNKNLKTINLENYSENWCKKIKSLNSKIIFLNLFEGKKDSINLIFDNKKEIFEQEINLIKNFCSSKKINLLEIKIPCKANTLIDDSIILDIEINTSNFMEELKFFLINIYSKYLLKNK